MLQKHTIYGHTNESLWSAVKGLDLQLSDRVLSICGSGDHPFAFSEFVREVVAIDINQAQITYAGTRSKALQEGNLEDFLPLIPELDELVRGKRFLSKSQEERRILLHGAICVLGNEKQLPTWLGSTRYFLGEDEAFPDIPYWSFPDHDRIGRIREKVGCISFQVGDIIEHLRTNADYTKVFLSNALLSGQNHGDGEIQGGLSCLGCLPKGSLLYSTEVSRRVKNATFGEPFRVHEDLTRIARANELPNSWKPVVYERV